MDFYGNPDYFAQAKNSEEVAKNIRKNLLEMLPELYKKLTPYERDILQKSFEEFCDNMRDYFCQGFKYDCEECSASNLCNLVELIAHLLN